MFEIERPAPLPEFQDRDFTVAFMAVEISDESIKQQCQKTEAIRVTGTGQLAF